MQVLVFYAVYKPFSKCINNHSKSFYWTTYWLRWCLLWPDLRLFFIRHLNLHSIMLILQWGARLTKNSVCNLFNFAFIIENYVVFMKYWTFLPFNLVPQRISSYSTGNKNKIPLFKVQHNFFKFFLSCSLVYLS